MCLTRLPLSSSPPHSAISIHCSSLSQFCHSQFYYIIIVLANAIDEVSIAASPFILLFSVLHLQVSGEVLNDLIIDVEHVGFLAGQNY
jgi:hypothetical protein